MAADFAKKPAGLPIHLLAVNAAGEEEGNTEYVKGRSQPVLQDTKDANVWGSWGVTWRDTVIVSPAGDKVGVYNLTEHDLQDPANYEELETKLRAVADGK
jgi:hypothetical protein